MDKAILVIISVLAFAASASAHDLWRGAHTEKDHALVANWLERGEAYYRSHRNDLTQKQYLNYWRGRGYDCVPTTYKGEGAICTHKDIPDISQDVMFRPKLYELGFRIGGSFCDVLTAEVVKRYGEYDRYVDKWFIWDNDTAVIRKYFRKYSGDDAFCMFTIKEKANG